jgi:hypothetical protein
MSLSSLVTPLDIGQSVSGDLHLSSRSASHVTALLRFFCPVVDVRGSYSLNIFHYAPVGTSLVTTDLDSDFASSVAKHNCILSQGLGFESQITSSSIQFRTVDDMTRFFPVFSSFIISSEEKSKGRKAIVENDIIKFDGIPSMDLKIVFNDMLDTIVFKSDDFEFSLGNLLFIYVSEFLDTRCNIIKSKSGEWNTVIPIAHVKYSINSRFLELSLIHLYSQSINGKFCSKSDITIFMEWIFGIKYHSSIPVYDLSVPGLIVEEGCGLFTFSRLLPDIDSEIPHRSKHHLSFCAFLTDFSDVNIQGFDHFNYLQIVGYEFHQWFINDCMKTGVDYQSFKPSDFIIFWDEDDFLRPHFRVFVHSASNSDARQLNSKFMTPVQMGLSYRSGFKPVNGTRSKISTDGLENHLFITALSTFRLIALGHSNIKKHYTTKLPPPEVFSLLSELGKMFYEIIMIMEFNLSVPSIMIDVLFHVTKAKGVPGLRFLDFSDFWFVLSSYYHSFFSDPLLRMCATLGIYHSNYIGCQIVTPRVMDFMKGMRIPKRISVFDFNYNLAELSRLYFPIMYNFSCPRIDMTDISFIPNFSFHMRLFEVNKSYTYVQKKDLRGHVNIVSRCITFRGLVNSEIKDYFFYPSQYNKKANVVDDYPCDRVIISEIDTSALRDLVGDIKLNSSESDFNHVLNNSDVRDIYNSFDDVQKMTKDSISREVERSKKAFGQNFDRNSVHNSKYSNKNISKTKDLFDKHDAEVKKKKETEDFFGSSIVNEAKREKERKEYLEKEKLESDRISNEFKKLGEEEYVKNLKDTFEEMSKEGFVFKPFYVRPDSEVSPWRESKLDDPIKLFKEDNDEEDDEIPLENARKRIKIKDKEEEDPEPLIDFSSVKEVIDDVSEEVPLNKDSEDLWDEIEDWGCDSDDNCEIVTEKSEIEELKDRIRLLQLCLINKDKEIQDMRNEEKTRKEKRREKKKRKRKDFLLLPLEE